MPISAGHPSQPFWIVGEAPGANEIASGVPFSGASGDLLNTLLTETGFHRSDFFITNVCHERPPGNDISKWFYTKSEGKRQNIPERAGKWPDRRITDGLALLTSQLETHQPQLILALGNTALWGLTGEWGIAKWRGSQLELVSARVIPSIHPAAVLRDWASRVLLSHDLRRARRDSISRVSKPDWRFTISPNVETVLQWLADIPVGAPIAADIETRARQIACIGLATSKLDAICIPLMSVERPSGFYLPDEEHAIVLALRRVLTSPDYHVVWQSGAYDLQYFAAQYGFLPHLSDDTMLMQHVAFPGLTKGLAFLSSLHCQYHRYWKDDGREWNASGRGDEMQLWRYNCEDCVRTYEVWESLSRVLTSTSLRPQYDFQIKELFPIMLRAMIRGIRYDAGRKREQALVIEAYRAAALEWLQKVIGPDFNPNSHTQMKQLFYEELSVPAIKNRKTGNLTLDDEALERIGRRVPILKPLIDHIGIVRSCRVLLSNILEVELPPDGRARSTINLAGTETFRFSSSEDAFGYGFNMQTITMGTEK